MILRDSKGRFVSRPRKEAHKMDPITSFVLWIIFGIPLYGLILLSMMGLMYQLREIVRFLKH